MTNWLTVAKTSIQHLTPYEPGKSIDSVARKYGLQDIIKLASNENPLGPSPLAIEAIQASTKDYAHYPNSDNPVLKKKLADHFSVPANQIMLGAGSEQVLSHLANAIVRPNEEILMSQYAFATYHIIAEVIGAQPVIVPAKAWGHDLTAMAQAVNARTRLIFIANPNNPTGTCFTHETLQHFLSQVRRDVLIIIDEAYYEYACTDPHYPKTLALCQSHANCVVTRTFSKAHGLAGLRIGYGIGHPTLAEVYHRIRLPFNIATPAIAAAIAALSDKDHLHHTLSLNEAGRMQLSSGLSALGYDCMPTKHTNFITFKAGPNAQKINELLLQQGIIVRPLLDYGLPKHLRVSIGTTLQNERFLATLQQIGEQHGF